jgi:hypothetical protein
MALQTRILVRGIASLLVSAMPAAGSLLAVTSTGCGSSSNEIVIPDAADVPPPSNERGEAIDPSTYKRVKIE